MFLFFRYFYSILQSFVDVPPVCVKCAMKYDIENVKGNMLPILFVSTQNMLYIMHHQLIL